MKIGINCTRLDPAYKGGVNSFAFGLLDGFAASKRDHDFVIFASPFNRAIFSRYEGLPNFRVTEIHEAYPPAEHGRLQWIARRIFPALPWRLRYRLPLPGINKWLNARYAGEMEKAADVIFTPYVPPPLFPFCARPTVYSLHDLQHVHFPEFFSPEQRLERNANFDATVKHASMIQATSRQMRDEFIKNFPGLAPERIAIIPEGVDVGLYSNAIGLADVKSRYHLPQDFIFYPAQLWHHKDHLTILRALLQLKREGLVIPLVLTGARTSATKAIFDFVEENALSSQVHYLGLVPYEDVVALHRAARFLVTASLYEAGSIPMLEAAAAGTPIVGSAIPSHMEHAEDLQINLFPPGNSEALAAVLARIWRDDGLVASQVQHNMTAIQNFSWARAAERYLDTFESLAPSR